MLCRTPHFPSKRRKSNNDQTTDALEAASYARRATWISTAVIAAVLIIDQWSKFWIKLNMSYGEEFLILGQSWARIHFVENEGMAFGISLGAETGKLLLTLFRMVAAGFLVFIIRSLIKTKESIGLIVSFSLILAGAVGNIIDSAIYGQIFSASYYHGDPAVLFPEEGGYASFLHGKVVDMFYFPIIDTTLPDWLPIWGGEPFLFFQPVFNVADAAITTGIISILLFYRRFFREQKQSEKTAVDSPVDQPQ